MDEEDYRSIVRGRLAEDDFIEEDNGVSGYADNGEDHWDRGEEEENEEDEAEKRTSHLPCSLLLRQLATDASSLCSTGGRVSSASAES